MQTECSADLFGFAPVEGRAVVAGFDGGKMTSDAGALLLGATDRAIGLVERFAECFADSRAPELIEHEVGTLVGQRVFAIGAGLRRSGRSRRAAPRPDDGGAGRQAVGPAQGLCAVGRQIDAQPARAGRAGADALSPDRLGRRQDRGAVCRSVRGGAPTPAKADHPRSRCHRRSAARASGRAVLSRLLRLLLLSAAVHFLRVASVGGQSCGAPTSTRRPARSRRRRASSPRSAPAGPRCASCCAPIRVLPARP